MLHLDLSNGEIAWLFLGFGVFAYLIAVLSRGAFFFICILYFLAFAWWGYHLHWSAFVVTGYLMASVYAAIFVWYVVKTRKAIKARTAWYGRLGQLSSNKEVKK